MAKVLISDQYLDDIADAIRAKNGSQSTYTPAQMSTAILAIPTGGGGTPTLQAKSNINPLTTSQTITADSGYDGLSSVQINAMPTGSLTDLIAVKGTVTNNIMFVTPRVTVEPGYISGIGDPFVTGTGVTVRASELVSGTLSITTNGTKDVTNYASAAVNVPTYTLLASTEYTISNFTTTSNTSQGTIQIGAIGTDKIIYVKVRDKAGKRAGYFLGSDTFFFPTNKANNTTSAQNIAARTTHRYSTSSQYGVYTSGSTTGYGVFGYSLTAAGALTIYKRYSSNYSLIIDGTYSVEVYALDYAPSQGKPYDYSYPTT